MKSLYTTYGDSYFGSDEKVQCDDKQIDVKLSSPGSNKPGINPEQLFACGYSSCYGMAIKYVAKELGIELKDYQVHADVELHKDESGFFFKTTLDVHMPSDMSSNNIAKLINAAHKICPYSRAIKNNLKVATKVNGTELHSH